MSKTRVLITVTTYPLPSRSYDELICTAGILPSGEWIRIYPVPLTFLDYKKYQWVELELIEHEPRRDFRPESRWICLPADRQLQKRMLLSIISPISSNISLRTMRDARQK